MGGIFERMVRCMTRCLRKVLGRARVNYQELSTLLKEVENVLNNCLLTVVYYDELIT